MANGFLTAVVSFVLVAHLHFQHVQGVRPSYRNFEDYLQHLDKNLQSSIIKLGGGESGKSETTVATEDTAAEPTTTTDNTLFTNIPDDDKKNITCCVLGELAGNKGFHCYAEFYAARIVLRNANRAHSKKLGFYGKFKIPRYAERLMKTFEQCVAGHGLIFHTCCHLATMERKGRRPNATWNRSKA